ncbi:hypothetical protein [Hominifimenecus sp. rT4P-3]|uniref:hypothetical protein n=1 Tax=Hominifimenecus sp. rT4P-3 TaxID=3242979 RepID=UPI003DA27202
MFTIKNNRIAITRGDTAIIKVELMNHTWAEGDRMYFTVKKHAGNTDITIQKIIDEFSDGLANIYLSQYDTNIPAGDYVYDLQCNLADGRIDTIVGPEEFQVLEGVTDD